MKNLLLIGFCALLCIIPFVVVSFFNQPVGDDFWCIWMVKKYGFAEAQYLWFISMNNRYSANMITSLNAIFFDSVLGFKIIPVLMIIGWICSVYYFMSSILQGTISAVQKLSCSLFIAAVYYINLPGVHDGVYWVASLACYQLPVTLLLLLSGWLLKKTEPLSFVQHVFLFLSVILICGFNELISFMMAAASFVLLLYGRQQKQLIKLFTIVLIASVLSLLARIPGMMHRYNDSVINTTHMSFKEVLITSTLQTGYHLVMRCLLSPSFWLGGLFVFLFVYRNHHQIKKANLLQLAKLKWIPALFVLFLILFPGFLFVFVENKIAGMRVINISYFVCMTFVYVLIAGIAYNIAIKKNEPGVTGFLIRYQNLLVILLVTLTIVVPGNVHVVSKSLISGDARRYNSEVDNRFLSLKKCESAICTISSLSSKPYILCPVDVCQDDRILAYLEKVYGKKILVSR